MGILKGSSGLAMREEQEPIAAWIKSTLEAKGWTAYRWAKETGGKVNVTTISRAMSPDYPSVTSSTTIHHLADAAGVPRPNFEPGEPFAFSASLLAQMLPPVLVAMGCSIPNEEDLALGAKLLQRGLAFAQANPEVATDPVRARIAMLALIDSGQQ